MTKNINLSVFDAISYFQKQSHLYEVGEKPYQNFKIHKNEENNLPKRPFWSHWDIVASKSPNYYAKPIFTVRNKITIV